MKLLEKYISLIEKTIENHIPDNEDHQLFTPLKYILSIGGKRIRPALCLMACELYGGNVDNALSSALAIEYFHNFSLIHDDIMDVAPVRRGFPTVHKKWSENQAILSGDALLVFSYQLLENAPENNFKSIFKLFNQTALEVCIGQQLDMEFEERNDVSENDYLNMIRQKTSVLLAASLKIGSLCGNANKEEAEKIYQFGINLGMAFQLRDDYLDVFGEANAFGKQSGGDIIADKKTYMLIKTFEKSSQMQSDTLMKMVNNSEISNVSKIKTTKAIMLDLDIQSDVKNLTSVYYNQAMVSLEAMEISSKSKALIKDFADELMDRSI